MEITVALSPEDLRSEHKGLNCSATKFKHFTNQAQKAIRFAGKAQFQIWANGQLSNYNAIYPPTPPPKIEFIPPKETRIVRIEGKGDVGIIEESRWEEGQWTYRDYTFNKQSVMSFGSPDSVQEAIIHLGIDALFEEPKGD